jgi:BAH domain
VERLFKGPSGQRFVFGCYYASKRYRPPQTISPDNSCYYPGPHETFCDSNRLFHRNEVFWTPLFDTLPLDSVIGRCLIMDPQVWQLGRPKSPLYLEDDVYVCEYQIDRNQRSFEKIPQKNHYHVSTEPYVFNRFEAKLCLRRDFTVRPSL